MHVEENQMANALPDMLTGVLRTSLRGTAWRGTPLRLRDAMKRDL